MASTFLYQNQVCFHLQGGGLLDGLCFKNSRASVATAMGIGPAKIESHEELGRSNPS